MGFILGIAIGSLLTGSQLLIAAEPPPSSSRQPSAGVDAQLRSRLEAALERWCRWLSRYVQPVPGTDLYTLSPKLNTGPGYRDVAGNQFAAAAAGYWLARAATVHGDCPDFRGRCRENGTVPLWPDPQVARPLQGLIELSLGSHITVRTIDRPEIPKWGAGQSAADDWHADLFAATSGMLMLRGLASPERGQLLAILAWEADKQVEYGVSPKWRTMPGRWPAGSVGESNAWSTALLQAARVALPDSPRQEAWRNAAIDYSLNSICMPDDMTSVGIVAGRPLRERVKGANFEPGGIQEHHGFYHPGYVGWPLAYQAFAELMDQGMPRSARDPDVYLRHWKQVFDRLKQGTFANGRFIHCAGDDWNAYGYGNDHILPIAIFAAVRFGDADAARLADQWLTLMEHAQSLTGGPIQGARLARLQEHYINDFAWYEAVSGANLAHALWVLDRLDAGKMPSPSTEQQYNARNTGTYHEPNARLVWHRDERRWASFCWRSAFGQWQAIVQPTRLPHLLKFNHNSMGILEAAEAAPQCKLQWFKIETPEPGGFWSLGAVDRLSKKGQKDAFLVRQHQALVVLPDGPSLLVDCCQALDRVALVRTGGLGLRLAADIFNQHQVKIAIDGEEKVFGLHPDRDTWHDLRTRSLRIEGLLRIDAIAGEGTFQLLQKRRRSPDFRESPYPNDPRAVEESLLSHELYFGPPRCERSETATPGTWLRNMVLRIDCDPPEPPPRPAATVAGRPPCFAVELPDVRRTVAINFADTEQSLDSPSGPVKVAPRSVVVVARKGPSP
jgi:hypothetical protein